MKNTKLVLAEFTDQPPILVVVHLGSAEFAIDLSSVASIAMPLDPVRCADRPDGVAGIVRLRGETVPVLEPRGVFGFDCASKINRASSGQAGDERMIVLSADDAQAILRVDRIISIRVEASAARNSRIEHPQGVLALLSAGCVDHLAASGARADGQCRGIAVIDVGAFLKACCPIEGLDGVRRARTLVGAHSEPASRVWRNRRRPEKRAA